MSAHPDHQAAAAPWPATLHELRTALSRYGLPGDVEAFERNLAAALDASPINNLTAATEVATTYLHRLLLRTSPDAMNSLATPIDGQKWTPAAEAFTRLHAGGSQ